MARTVIHYCLLLGTLSACGSEAGRITVRTTARSYAPGEAVVLTITNSGAATVYSDPCGGETEPAPLFGRPAAGAGSARACIKAPPGGPRAVRPGGTAVDTLLLSGNADAGLWRAQLVLRNARGAMLPAAAGASNRFRVRER